jgi:hypothetical protein
MLLLHGEVVLFEQLLKLLGVVALLALIVYVAWDAVGWGKRN